MTWKAEVLAIVRNHWGVGQTFCLRDLYEFETELERMHPGNRNIRAKIRQTVQYLRDARLLEFVDDLGYYRLRLGRDVG